MKHRSFVLGAAAFVAACRPQPIQIVPMASAPATTAPRPAPVRPPPVDPGTTASATLRDLAGTRVGAATFTDTPSGLLVTASITGVGLGPHAVHLHETGKCVAPFTSAGAHFNPTSRRHGFRTTAGPHLGDLPNIDMPAAGRLKFEFVIPDVTLRGKHALLDADGASIVIDSARDDYVSDPTGKSGARLACGVLIGR